MEKWVEWTSVKDRLPENDNFVFVIVTGRYRNLRFENAIEIGNYVDGEGWILEAWPEWESPAVTHWMPMPEPPEE